MTIKIDFDLFIDIVEFPSHLILTADGAGNNGDYYQSGEGSDENDDDEDSMFSLSHDDDDTSYGGESSADDSFCIDFDYFDINEPISAQLARMEAQIRDRIFGINNDLLLPLQPSGEQDNDADSLVLANGRGVPRRHLEFHDSLLLTRFRALEDEMPPPLIDIADTDYDEEDEEDDYSCVSESDFEEVIMTPNPRSISNSNISTTSCDMMEEDFTTYLLSLDDMRIIGVDDSGEEKSPNHHHHQSQPSSSSSNGGANRCPPIRGILRRTSSSMGSTARRSSTTSRA